MEKSTDPDQLYTSFDSIEDSTYNSNWYGLIQHLTHKGLETLRSIFKKNSSDNKEIGLTRDEFKEAICGIYKNGKYGNQSVLLFNEIAEDKTRIDWNNFLDFLIENMSPKTDLPVQLTVGSIEPVSHMSRETIKKIVVIETEKYFCYAAISQYGRIGIYDGNLNFMTSYHVIMTHKDVERTDDERRRRNRWITDAIFCVDIQMLIVTNSTRSIAIYDASGLKHEPLWLIIGSPEIIECLAYKKISEYKIGQGSQCILFGGTNTGDVIFFKFLQPETSLLRRKHTEKINIIYWHELKHEKEYLKIKPYKNVHSNNIEQMDFNNKENAIISCSKDPYVSVIKTFLSRSKTPYILKMRKGCNCFAYSNFLKIIVTGSSDQIIRIWNSVLISNIIAILKGHNANILDVAVMDTQHMVISFSEDGIIKLWDINENKCLQTETIQFPAFTILGKAIEYGRKNIYPGPKRASKYFGMHEENGLNKKYFGIPEVEERPMHTDTSESFKGSTSTWERSNLLVTCCNYIAILNVNYERSDIRRLNEMTILPPPPLQNSVLIPAYWQVRAKELESNQSQVIEKNIKDTLKNLDFIINKDLFDTEGSNSDINYKIAILETKKMQMKAHVAKGAPFLALSLLKIEDLKLSVDLKTTNKSFRNIKKMLKGASVRDQAFSEPSSSKSPGSSRSNSILL